MSDRYSLPEVDPDLVRRVHRILDPICRHYFRGEVRGLERVPAEPTLVVGNHDGGVLPSDGIVLGWAWHERFAFLRPLRVLMHDFPLHLTQRLNTFLHGVGVISASPHALEAALDGGQSVLVYPGAAHEAFRRWRERAVVDLAGRTGFVVRALRRGLPITPVVSAGAHDTLFVLARGQAIAERLGIKRHFRAEVWPLAIGLPWGLWWGPMWPYLPLPSKITVEVLPPIDARGILGRAPKPEDADDKELVDRVFAQVVERMNEGLRRLYGERRWPVIG